MVSRHIRALFNIQYEYHWVWISTPLTPRQLQSPVELSALTPANQSLSGGIFCPFCKLFHYATFLKRDNSLYTFCCIKKIRQWAPYHINKAKHKPAPIKYPDPRMRIALTKYGWMSQCWWFRCSVLFISQVVPSLNIFKLSSSANDVNLIRCIPVNLFYVVHQRKYFRLKNIWMEIIFDCLLWQSSHHWW